MKIESVFVVLSLVTCTVGVIISIKGIQYTNRGIIN